MSEDEDEIILPGSLPLLKPKVPGAGARDGLADGAAADGAAQDALPDGAPQDAGLPDEYLPPGPSGAPPGDAGLARGVGEEHTLEAEEADEGVRIDVFLAQKLPAHSRTWLARHIDEGHVALVRGEARSVRRGLRLEAGDIVSIRLLPREAAYAVPEKIPLTIVYEDPYIVVINKQPGLTVHPGNSAKSGTLANAIAYHFGELSHVQGPMRPGIVHRLDKDTSGVILVAKDDQTHWAIANQFRERTVQKEYHAVCRGVISFDADLISGPIGPDRRQPTRMAIRMDVGRSAETYFEVIERFAGHTYVRCMPKTGRTHQIRVHMMSAGHPLVSDRLYGSWVPSLAEICPRQALHARRLTITHPASGERVTFEAPIPADIDALLVHLRG